MKKTLVSKSYNKSIFILPTPVATQTTAKTMSAEEQEYENWKKANGLDRRLSREQYEVVFNIY